MPDQKKFILIVDDNDSVLETMSWVFIGEDFLVETAYNLKEAKSILKSNSNIFLVLSEVNLEYNERGFELGEICDNLNIELVLMSGDSSYSRKAQKAGRLFLSKNGDYRDFVEKFTEKIKNNDISLSQPGEAYFLLRFETDFVLERL
ncbi:MAG: hypothetical protein R6V40_00870 [Candidatus Moraniibacteriota bacterium]